MHTCALNEQNNISQKTHFVNGLILANHLNKADSKLTKKQPACASCFWSEYIVQAPAYFCIAAIIGAKRLNFRVRDGNGCDPLAHGT